MVSNQYYENVDYTAVDINSGSKIDVMALPNFSPHGLRFICVPFMGGPVGYTYEIGIWAIENGTFRQELIFNNPPEEGDYEWSFVDWDGEKKVNLRVTRRENMKEIIRDAEAILTTNGWEIKVPENQ